jgi:hypothetical protein
MTTNDDQQAENGGNVTNALKAKLDERRAREAAQQAQRELLGKSDADLLRAELGEVPRGPLSDWQRQLNEVCRSITFEEIFERLLGAGIIAKTEYPLSQWRPDSNKFSCPEPAHADGHPSAWGSRTKTNDNGNAGLWGCGTCGNGVGGDKYSLAQYLYGWSGREYKPRFNELCENMARDFRGVVKPSPIVAPVIVVNEPEQTTFNVVPLQVSPTMDGGEAEESDAEFAKYPTYNLADVLPGKNTYLDFYCAEALKADVPREFPLWAGLTALSVAIGRSVGLLHIEIPTYCNLFVCLTTKSQGGKGRTMRPMRSILEAHVSFDDTPIHSGLAPEGSRVLKLPGSAEKLIRNLQVIGGGKAWTAPTLIEFDELQSLITKSAGNSSYKDYVIEFSDANDNIYTGSNANGEACLRDGFVSFFTGTQPGHLRDQFTRRDADRGLLNRFIFVFGAPVKKRAWDVPQQDWNLAGMSLAHIVKWTQSLPANNSKKTGHWITRDDWDDDARDEWIRFFEARIEPDEAGENSNILGAMSTKMLKLILLFACNDESDRIRLSHVRSAFALYDYVVECTLTLAQEINRTEISDHMKMFLDAVAKFETKYKKPPTLQQLNNRDRRIQKINEEDRAKIIYKLMTTKQLFHVQTRSRSGRGKPGEAYTTSLGLWDTTSQVEVTPI